MFHRLMCLALAIASASPVFAVERIALVVGINDYENLETLHTAVNDARAVGAALAQHGFTIVETTDPTRREFSRKLAEVVGAVEPGDDVIFFFAGHGVAVDSVNYLLPSDLPELLPGDEGALRDEAFSAADIIDRFKSAGARNTIAILDACRNNPLRSRGRSLGSTRGLARMEVEQGSSFCSRLTRDRRRSIPCRTRPAQRIPCSPASCCLTSATAHSRFRKSRALCAETCAPPRKPPAPISSPHIMMRWRTISG